MLGLFGLNVIENKIIVFNVFQLLYEMKYIGKKHVQSKISHMTRSIRVSPIRSLLKDIKNGSIPSTHNLSAKEVSLLFQAIKVLIVKGLIKGKFKANFNKNGLIMNLEVESLTITEKGLSVYANSIKNETFDFKTLDAVWEWLEGYVDTENLWSIDKTKLIEDILSKVKLLGYDIMEFGAPKPTQDLIFDHHIGKITVNNFEHLKMFLNNQPKRSVEMTIVKFLNDTINTMTEMKIVLKGIMDQNMTFVAYFMGDKRLMTLLLYMVDHGYINLDVAYKESRMMDIQIHHVSLRDSGLKYLEDPTLVKLKNKPMMTQVILDALKSVDSNKPIKEHPLGEMVASEYLQ